MSTRDDQSSGEKLAFFLLKSEPYRERRGSLYLPLKLLDRQITLCWPCVGDVMKISIVGAHSCMVETLSSLDLVYNVAVGMLKN
jgi:hypothetical protein